MIDTIYFDLSGVNSSDCLKILLQTIDGHKIFYGSDVPIGLFQGLILPGDNARLKVNGKDLLG